MVNLRKIMYVVFTLTITLIVSCYASAVYPTNQHRINATASSSRESLTIGMALMSKRLIFIGQLPNVFAVLWQWNPDTDFISRKIRYSKSNSEILNGMMEFSYSSFGRRYLNGVVL